MTDRPFVSVVSLVALTSAALLAPAKAQVPMTGRFVAEARCPITRAIPDDTGSVDPGGLATEPGRAYDLVGRNADPATHYHVLVPGAEPERRWVAVGCGRVEADATQAADLRGEGRRVAQLDAKGARSDDAQRGASGDQVEDLVLAITWPPAFCERNPGSAQCREPFETRAAGLRFVLHGLWPQPYGAFYCGVPEAIEDRDRDGDWGELDPVDLPAELRDRLDRAMPGTAAALDRHEWVRHGTCYGTDAADYFADSLMILSAINRSAVRALFAGNVSQYVGDWQIARAFDRSFGQGAGARVELVCHEDGFRTIITELRINLRGRIEPGVDIGRLITAAPRADNDCGGGEVDDIGTQY